MFPPGTSIRFRSASIERAAGIASVPAAKTSLSNRVFCTARIGYNRNRLAEVRSPVPALVQHVQIDLGAKVRKGTKLFTLSSAQIGVLKSRLIGVGRRFRVAKANLKRQKALHKSGGASTRDVELARLRLAEASSSLAAISQSLRISGISVRGFSGAFALVAPIAGTVVQRPAVLGAKAGPGISLATIADTSSMWAILDVNEWDASLVRPGLAVKIRVDGLTGRVFEGKITWVAAEVNPRTRFVRARAEIANPRGGLRANQFARATIHLSSTRADVTVPVQSVQRLGNGQVVFVRLKNGVYEPRAVRLGRSDGRRVHVSGRLKVGDAVVTTGAFLLRTELSKDSIGAGCCEVERPGSK
ncbi:MAG: efflux RND transporter periplasmic adaptor subunit [bacterium]